jgi:hypothetical protein
MPARTAVLAHRDLTFQPQPRLNTHGLASAPALIPTRPHAHDARDLNSGLNAGEAVQGLSESPNAPTTHSPVITASLREPAQHGTSARRKAPSVTVSPVRQQAPNNLDTVVGSKHVPMAT